MSGLARWKENRIRQEICLKGLKHTNTSSSGNGLDGANQQGWNGTPLVLFWHKTAARRKTNRLYWIILRVALLIAGVAACVWVYLDHLESTHGTATQGVRRLLQ